MVLVGCSLSTRQTNELMSVARKKSAESFAEGFFAARLVKFLVECLISSFVAVIDSSGEIGVLVVLEGVVLIVTSWVVIVDVLGHVVLGIGGILCSVVACGVVVVLVVLLSLGVVSVVRRLTEHGLKGHAVGVDCIAGSLDLVGNNARRKDRSGEVLHLVSKQRVQGSTRKF